MRAWGRPPVPREHGAWGLLLQPFVAGAVLAGKAECALAAALGLVLLGFLLREPLTVIARHRLVWRRGGEQESTAWRWLALEAVGAAGCFWVASGSAPLGPLLLLTTAAALFTVASVWVTVRNLQRSVVFQLVSAAGLGLTALLAALVALGGIPDWAWWLYGVLTAHAGASILVVHARLDARAGRGPGTARAAWAAQAAQAVVGCTTGALVWPFLFSAAVNGVELWRLRSPERLWEPLTRVGYRTLAVALTHMAAAIYSLWPAARI
jgi:hypothetical protein